MLTVPQLVSRFDQTLLSAPLPRTRSVRLKGAGEGKRRAGCFFLATSVTARVGVLRSRLSDCFPIRVRSVSFFKSPQRVFQSARDAR
jgi:hypothetical protein